MNYDIACEDPRLIVNPCIVDIALHSECYFLGGVRHSIDDDMRFRLADGESPSKVLHLPFVNSYIDVIERFDGLKPVKSKVNRVVVGSDPFLDNSYFVSSDGEIESIYTFVPCAKCNVCSSKMMSSYVQRCQFALQESDTEAFFVTLQYNDAHLPECGSLDIRDIQLFQKKLKSAVSRLWRYYATSSIDLDDLSALKSKWRSVGRNLKFIYSGEFGSESDRPHWHVLIFGFPPFLPSSGTWSVAFDTILRHQLVMYAWRDSVRKDNGLFESFLEYRIKYPKVFYRSAYYDPYSKGYINMSEVESAKACSYALKYSFKHFSDGCSSIYGCSNNLGVAFARSKFDELVKSPDHKITFKSILTGCVSSVNLCGYYLKKLFPSDSVLVPVKLRKAFRDVIVTSAKLLNNRFVIGSVRKWTIRIRDFCRSKFPFLDFSYKCLDFGKYHSGDLFYDYKYSSDDILTGLSFIRPKLRCSPHIRYLIFESFSFLESCYKEILSIDFVYDYFLKMSNLRNWFFSQFQKRSRSEVLVSGIDFAEVMSHYKAISIL